MDTNENKQEEAPMSIEKRLSELLLRGWTMLANTCLIEHCRCPLMRNTDKRDYCCNCETWATNKGEGERMAFTDLINPTKAKVTVNSNQRTIIEIPKQSFNPKPQLDTSIKQIHDEKLLYLSERLRTETDLRLIEMLLKVINLCIQNIKELNTLK